MDGDPRELELWMDLAQDREGSGLSTLTEYLARHAALDAEVVARAWLEAGREAGADVELEHGDVEVGATADDRRTVGPYRLEREVGRGGQGVVYLAEHSGLGRRVALKLLAPGAIGGDAARLRFEREAAVAAGLEHPGLGTVFEAGRADGVDYLAMQWLPGGSLAETLARDRAAGLMGRALRPPFGGRAEPDEVSERAAIDACVRLVADAARALDAAHTAGVIHRDVKPSNLLFDADGRPVWVDFGLARDASRAALTVSGEQLGTPAYMAPEQVAGASGQLDARADVWALGAVLFEVLTLRRAFDRPSAEATLFAIHTEEAPRLTELNPRAPRDLAVICQVALERDRGRRYRSAGALADDLERFLEHRPILARPAPSWLRAVRWAQRYPAGAAALGVVLLASAAIGALVGGFRAERENLAAQRDAAIDGQAQLTDREVAEALRAELESVLWPIEPALAPRADAWLAELDRLEGDLPLHRATLAELEERAANEGAPDPAEARLAAFLTELIAAVEGLADERAQVAVRHSRALAHAARTSGDAAWTACRAAVAASPRYGGLDLAPQLGLVPLGANAAGLWEFWVFESGARPDFVDGVGARPRAGDGVVLALVPGGTAHVGAHPVDGPNVDEQAQQNEVPPHAVALTPFFIGVFELTQDQWRRTADGANPSAYPEGHALDGVVFATAISPVEQVTRPDAERVLARLGLVLPTEVQWEYAARAGTHTPWSYGADPLLAGAHANFYADEARPYADGHPFRDTEFGVDDGFARHAPVGSYAANPFGLFDVHGNVFEWCADDYRPYSSAARPGDGTRVGDGPADHGVIRGGGFFWPAAYGRAARRVPMIPTEPSSDLGVRPARAVERVGDH